MGLRLQNMRDRRKDKGVKICPQVNMSEVAFLEPIEDEEPESEDDDQLDLSKQPDDGEGNADPEVQKKLDDENMAAATDKIMKKMQKNSVAADG